MGEGSRGAVPEIFCGSVNINFTLNLGLLQQNPQHDHEAALRDGVSAVNQEWAVGPGAFHERSSICKWKKQLFVRPFCCKWNRLRKTRRQVRENKLTNCIRIWSLKSGGYAFVYWPNFLPMVLDKYRLMSLDFLIQTFAGGCFLFRL